MVITRIHELRMCMTGAQNGGTKVSCRLCLEASMTPIKSKHRPRHGPQVSKNGSGGLQRLRGCGLETVAVGQSSMRCSWTDTCEVPQRHLEKCAHICAPYSMCHMLSVHETGSSATSWKSIRFKVTGWRLPLNYHTKGGSHTGVFHCL